MDGQRSVLIVDPSEETREVLEVALRRRGVKTLTAGRTEAGMRLAREHQPDLIVVDLEMSDSPEALSVDFADKAPGSHPRLVLLGKVRGLRKSLPGGEFIPKPYHYGPLIRRIEELLGEEADSPRSLDRADVVCDSRGRSGRPV